MSSAIQVLAVENCIRKVPEVFSPVALSNANPETLQATGKETDEDTRLRDKLAIEVVVLSKALKTLQRYRARGPGS